MKIHPKYGFRYGHTAEEWIEVLNRHGAGMSLPGSIAARIAAGGDSPEAKADSGRSEPRPGRCPPRPAKR